MNSPASVFMMPLDTAFALVARARLAAYRSGLFSVSRLEAPVISVGNITTGGTGKTPLVEWVCRAIAYENTSAGAGDERKLCVLTRGYGRVNPNSQVVVSNGAEIFANEQEAGDEPFLLARNLLGIAAVISNPNRLAAGQWAIENLKSNVFVLDDGFQHLRLDRNLDLVVIDATNPWGDGRLLPSGRLREPLEGLARADCVVITRSDQVENLSSLRSEIRRLAGDVPVLLSRMKTSRFGTFGGEPIERDGLQRSVGAFCGVGNPNSFFNHLRREGYTVSFTRAFPDHHRYTQADVASVVKEAKARGVEALITTAKDATKLTSLALDMPCYVLEIEISIDEEERLVEIIRNAICQNRKF